MSTEFRPGCHSLVLFLASLLFFSFLYITEVYFEPQVWGSNFFSPVLYFFIVIIFLKFFLSGFIYEVVVRSIFLGLAFATGLYISCFRDEWKTYGIYICVMSFFHFSEFCATAMTNPKTLSIDSFLLNHSLQYGIAALACSLEWITEKYFFPSLKEHTMLSLIGLFLCVLGEFLRKGAMFTAKTNFNHQVQYIKVKDHSLVTNGIYSWFRHPSYVGWFYWAIGTQIVLLNPICTIGFTVTSWFYFRERIYFEEYTLLNFFGKDYVDYQGKVPTGIPFIKGYIIE